MLHPFWKWSGWLSCLSLGLAGCLHQQDWRSAVANSLTRTVADRQESRVVPRVIGPRRESSPTFVPNSKVAIPAAAVAQPKAPASAVVGPLRSRSTATAVVAAPTSLDEAQPRGAKVLPAGFVPPPAPPTSPAEAIPTEPVVVKESPTRLPAKPLPSAGERPDRSADAPFAEFERSIVAGRENANGSIDPSVSKTWLPPSEKGLPTSTATQAVIEKRGHPAMNLSSSDDSQSEPTTTVPTTTGSPSRPSQAIEEAGVPGSEPDHDDHSRDLPLIIPARHTRAAAESSLPPREPPSSGTNAAPRKLSPESVGLAKELPDVSDIPNNSTPAELPSKIEHPAHRPSDVAKLVDQVFEELRHQRLAEARRRTESLRQLVARHLMTVTADAGPAEATERIGPGTANLEPRRFHPDPAATTAEKPVSKTWMEDN